MPQLIRDLRDVAPADDRVFGGKACGLARLLQAGARVPAGFAVAALSGDAAAWPAARRDEWRRRVDVLLRAGTVAVRSSAVGEDSAGRSFAGLFETVLGVTDADAAVRAAVRCLASGASERVRAYAPTADPIAVGLVVQSQVRARAAGVCFSVDPSGRDRAVVIESVAGTGDALVSGHAEPERWRVYRTGLGTWDARRDGRDDRVLSSAEAVALATDATALAARFGHALDLEWAIDDTGLWWLQARPITAATQPVQYDIERLCDGVDDGPVSVWSNWNVRETMPEPLTPLTWTLWRDVILPVVAEPVFGVSRRSPLFAQVLGIDRIHGRIYWNMNAMFATPLGNAFFRRTLSAMDTQAAAVIESLVAAGVLTPRRLPGSALRVALGMLWAGLVSALRATRGVRPRHVLRSFEICAAQVAGRPPLAGCSDAELLREMALLGEPEAAPLRDGLSAVVCALFVYVSADRAFRRHPEARQLLTAGIQGNPTTAIALAIDQLIAAARPVADVFRDTPTTAQLLVALEATAGGQAWLGHLRAFLDRYGHRAPKEFDLGAPRWSEDPTMIIELVRAGLPAPPAESATNRLARMAEKRLAAVAAAVATRAWIVRAPLRCLAHLVTLYMPLREAPKHHAMVVFQRMRGASLELGRRLAARGVLVAAEDVAFLEWLEVQQLAGGATLPDLPGRIEQRRVGFARYLREKPPDVVRSDGVPVTADAQDPTDGVLRGAGASAGIASGPVRVLRTPDPRAMHDGDVLVVEFADPGWTPLFPRAAAVVMEVGGIMCHAAVIARELGIPAVFGVPGVTRRLQDGQRVTVDGVAGSVRPD
jgi:pyruvate,water dikinase